MISNSDTNNTSNNQANAAYEQYYPYQEPSAQSQWQCRLETGSQSGPRNNKWAEDQSQDTQALGHMGSGDWGEMEPIGKSQHYSLL